MPRRRSVDLRTPFYLLILRPVFVSHDCIAAGQGRPLISVQAVFDGGTSSPHLQRLRMEKTIDADGMSGGPVFYKGGAPGDYFARFAGMVMRGARDHLRLMSAGFLIDLALESETEQWSAWPAQI
jgi:hypothetical protein